MKCWVLFLGIATTTMANLQYRYQGKSYLQQSSDATLDQTKASVAIGWILDRCGVFPPTTLLLAIRPPHAPSAVMNQTPDGILGIDTWAIEPDL